jgi:predicted AAA+ superfamily ATPase
MIARYLEPVLEAALRQRPVVLLQGARQTGKTTLARAWADRAGAMFLTLDDPVVYSAAVTDPAGLVAGQAGPLVVDEVQRVPELLRAIKLAVDRDRRPGRFLLTGSASVLAVPKVSESLAGRMELLTLWPLSERELGGTKGPTLVDRLFGDGPALKSRRADPELKRRVLRGGYPEVPSLGERTREWFTSYLATVLQRDVRDLARIEDLAALPRLFRVLASRTAGLLSYAGLSRDVGLPQTTLKRYFALLETTFLAQTLPAWHTNLGRRLVKAPKILLTDTGLAAGVLGLDESRLAHEPELWGSLVETFVGMELMKQAGWSEVRPALHHFRSHSGDEVDLVLEGPAGDLVGIEVKAGVQVSADDFRGLKVLAAARPRRFRAGVVLHTGREAVPFGDRLFALPVSALWG